MAPINHTRSLKYVSKTSNHPPCIPRNIPSSIEKRLYTISSSEAEFNEAKADYERALGRAGYSAELNTTPNKTGPHVHIGSVEESYGTTLRSARMFPLTLGGNFLSSYNCTSPSNTRSTASSPKTRSSYSTRVLRIWIT